MNRHHRCLCLRCQIELIEKTYPAELASQAIKDLEKYKRPEPTKEQWKDWAKHHTSSDELEEE